VAAHHADGAIGVLCLGQHLDPCVLEDESEAGPHDDVVIGEHQGDAFPLSRHGPGR